jgi:hypothetical protein
LAFGVGLATGAGSGTGAGGTVFFTIFFTPPFAFGAAFGLESRRLLRGSGAELLAAIHLNGQSE